jgi:S-formylglutathione hydrolase FrmB
LSYTARFTLFFLAFLHQAASAQGRVRTEYLESQALGGRARFHVLLPTGYDSTGSYPVLWLLHGLGGDDSTWLRHSEVERYTLRYPMIVVLPAAHHSFYVNSPVVPNAGYETFITQELHAAVAQRFAVDTSREAIAGASMGGYGAAVLALRYPDRYRFAGLIMPVLALPDSMWRGDTVAAAWAVPLVDTAFGPSPSRHRDTHDPFQLLRAADSGSLPYFYVTVAQADDLPSSVPMSRRWTDALRALNVAYEYHEMPGGHDLATGDAALPGLLARCWLVITMPRRSPPN